MHLLSGKGWKSTHHEIEHSSVLLQVPSVPPNSYELTAKLGRRGWGPNLQYCTLENRLGFVFHDRSVANLSSRPDPFCRSSTSLTAAFRRPIASGHLATGIKHGRFYRELLSRLPGTRLRLPLLVRGPNTPLAPSFSVLGTTPFLQAMLITKNHEDKKQPEKSENLNV